MEAFLNSDPHEGVPSLIGFDAIGLAPFWEILKLAP